MTRLRFSPEVENALQRSLPVVALESTIITHGMPYPANLETALAVENEVRSQGAVPATIALDQGEIVVGLTTGQLENLAQASNVHKASRRDMGWILASGATGSTTVAATMICANLAGIRVFVTGGIGGVHRGAELTFDISADLLELSQTPVAVVCAGAKAILDIPKTLEVLETHGVPVLGFGTDEFPAFYTPISGCQVTRRVDSHDELASFLRAHWDLGLRSGAVVAVPIPSESALAHSEIETLIAAALAQADRQGIRGKEVTPFLLSTLATHSSGQTLTANIALIKNNARAGAALAVSLARTPTAPLIRPVHARP